MTRRTLLFLLTVLCLCATSWAELNFTKEQLEKHIDKVMADKMAKHHTPGTVIAILKDGKLFFSKGYGFAEIEKKIPMSPEKTVFRLGSISKLLTATTLMTYYDEGKVDFHQLVKEHLPTVPLSKPYGDKLQVSHLLTHTSGFDARYMNVLGRTAAPFVPLSSYMHSYIPPLVRPPGEIIQYCNFGASLAGLLVEKLSGEPLSITAQKRVFTPLGMKKTQFYVGSGLEKDIARGYGWHKGKHHALSYAFVPITPAGGASSTALDMARLGELFLSKKEGKLLRLSTMQKMQKTQFSSHKEFAGMGYGFFQYNKNGLRLVGHGGGVLGFSSIFYLVPKDRFAYFISTNLSNAFAFLDDVEKDILNEYFPHKKTPRPEEKREVSQLKKYCGRYRGNRFPRSTCAKMLSIVLPVISEKRIALNSSGKLVMDSVKFYFFSRYATELHPIGENLFRRADGRGLVAFVLGHSDKVKYMAFSSSPVSVFDAVPWYDTQLVHAFLLFLFIILFMSGFGHIAWPWWKKREIELPKWASILQCSICFINLLIPALPLIAVFPMEWECPNLVYGFPAYLQPFLLLPYVSLGLTLFATLAIPKVWKNSQMRKLFTAVTLGGLLYLPYLVTWNFFVWPY